MKKILKIGFIIIVIIAVLIVAWQLSLFVRVKNIEKKTFENFTGDYYYKITSNSKLTREIWVNDDYTMINLNESTIIWKDKKKDIYTTATKGGDSVTIQYVRDSELPFRFMDMFSGEIGPYITNWEWDSSVLWNFTASYKLLDKIRNIFMGLVEQPILTVKSISSETINGKDCYKIELRDLFVGREIYYIEKETCLPIRIIRKQDVQYAGKEPELEIYMEEFEYSFEPIKNYDLNIPNLDDCYVVVQESM